MRRLALIFLLAILFLSACRTASQVASTPLPARPTVSPAEFEITDPSKPIEVKAGSEFTITVKANRPAEFHWEVAEALDQKVVAYIWKEHISDDPLVPNASGRDIWRFKAIAPGTATIKLGYYRGNSDVSVENPVYTVVVK